MQKFLSTNTLKQIFILAIILVIGITLIWNLSFFISGALGAITLYILSRHLFKKLTQNLKWKRWIAALTIIIGFLILLAIPFWIIVELLIPKFAYLFQNSNQFIAKGQEFISMLRKYFPQISISQEQLQSIAQKAALIVPSILSATMAFVANLFTALFLLYFMFMGNEMMEKEVIRFMPMSNTNKNEFWTETRNMVVSNAIGIPVLIICQCIVAIIGYMIFGVDQAIIWGVLTGMASIIPVVGTMIIWVPLCIFMFATGDVGMAIGLTLYCAIVVSNIDNVLRFSILKKIGNVHPLITVFGVILGLNLFGIMGLIFGPLLITYFLLMIRIYRTEYNIKQNVILT